MNGSRLRLVHHVVGALVVGAWILAMGRLGLTQIAKRVHAPDLTVGQLLAAGGKDGEEGAARALALYHGESKIGWSASRRMRGAGGWIFVDQAVFKLVLQGVPQKLVSESHAVVGDDFAVKSFRMRIDNGMMRIAAEGRVEGAELVIKVTTAGKVFEDREPVGAAGVLLSPLVRPAVAARSPAPGESFVFPIFSPLSRGTENLEVVVEGKERLDTALGPVETLRLREILRGSITTQVWIDERGETIRELSPAGFESRAEPRAMALSIEEGSDAPVADLVFAVAVPVRGDLTAQAQTGTVHLRLEGIQTSEFPLLAGGRQSVEGDVVSIRADEPLAGFPLPYLGGDMDEALKSEPLVQAADPDIVAAARKIVGLDRPGAKVEARAASRKLHDWVFENVRKRNSAGIPSAVEVLREKTGDCNEHTVLYVALARAVGLPARIAVGLVWANARGGGPGLYYHAWPEVYLGVSGENAFGGAETSDGWFAMDPTLGQYPADAGHVRFLVGGIERQIDLLKLIGKLQVTVENEAQGTPEEAPQK